MGQEIGNVKYVETNGLGLIARKPKDVPVLIKKILFDPHIRNNMLIRLNKAKKLYGTGNISRVILNLKMSKDIIIRIIIKLIIVTI